MISGVLSHSSDPLDKVYAQYGILLESLENLPAIDYTLDAKRLYEQFTLATIKASRRFWPAYLNTSIFDVELGFPSWIPNLNPEWEEFSARYDEDMYGFLYHQNQSATPDSLVDLAALEGSIPGTISLKGQVTTQITALGIRIPDDDEYGAPFMALLIKWMRFFMENHTANNLEGYSADKILGFSETIAHNDSADQKARLTELFVLMYRDLGKIGLNEINDLDLYLSEMGKQLNEHRTWSNTLFYIHKQLKKTLLFTTAAGRVGRADAAVEVGDTIALLAGCSTPVVLRRDGSNWRYIGSTCLHGIMDGEAWPSDGGADKLETFVFI